MSSHVHQPAEAAGQDSRYEHASLWLSLCRAAAVGSLHQWLRRRRRHRLLMMAVMTAARAAAPDPRAWYRQGEHHSDLSMLQNPITLVRVGCGYCTSCSTPCISAVLVPVLHKLQHAMHLGCTGLADDEATAHIGSSSASAECIVHLRRGLSCSREPSARSPT